MASERKHGMNLGIVILLLAAVLLSGCGSLPSPQQESPTPHVTTDSGRVLTVETTPTPKTTAPPVTTATPLVQQTTPASRTALITANLPYGITISYPEDWMMEETGVVVNRDYGRTVVNIANLFSPDLTPAQIARGGPNPDRSRNTILTIDVDEAEVTDFERYFSLVSLALEREYESFTITKHNAQLQISVTDTFRGYKSYQMDFDAKEIRGKYIFTNVDGTIYIFAFSNPSAYSSEVEEIYKSVIISPQD